MIRKPGDSRSITAVLKLKLSVLYIPSANREIPLDCQNAQFIPTLDVTNEYFEIPIWGADIPKKTAIIPSGVYALKSMPFDLSGAPSTF